MCSLPLLQEFGELQVIIKEFSCWKNTYYFNDEETEIQRSFNIFSLPFLTSGISETRCQTFKFLVQYSFHVMPQYQTSLQNIFSIKKQTGQVEEEQGSEKIAMSLGPGPKLKFAEWDNI